MGLFSYRDMITGVSTGYAGAIAVVPLRRIGNDFHPVSLPVWGTYDGYGSVESIESGPISARFCEVFGSLLARGIITVDWSGIYETPMSPSTPHDVFRLLGLALARSEAAVTCEGDVLSFAILNATVAEELLLELPLDSKDLAAADPAALAGGAYEPARSIFADLGAEDPAQREAFASALGGFLALQRWLRQNGIGWSPPRDPSQYSQTEALAFLAAARQRFANEPLVLRGLQRYYDDDMQFDPELP